MGTDNATSTASAEGEGTESPDLSSHVGDVARARDVEFWFEDGTIVLVAHDVEFRVYKNILADHSPVFSDMFLALPRPKTRTRSSQSSQGDAPVIYLSDSPEDLRHVLRACMPKSTSSANPFAPARPSFYTISAHVRLGHKYQMNGIFTNAMAYLKSWYTSDYKTWAKHKLLPDHEVPFEPQHAVGVVNLAWLVNEPIILPPALLVCCSLGGEVVRGCEREDGSREWLSLADLGRRFSANTRLPLHKSILTSLMIPPFASPACRTQLRCREALKTVLKAVEEKWTLQHLWTQNRFEAIFAPINSCDDLMKTLCCASCYNMLNASKLEQRHTVWSLLPETMCVDEEVHGWPGYDCSD